MSDGLLLSDSLATKIEECKTELGLTGDITDAQFLELAKYTLAKYPECVDLANPADRLFQSIASN